MRLYAKPFTATIRGKGELNGIYAIRDKDGKELFPCRQGLNCLVRRAGEDGWRTVHESVSVTQEGAAARVRLGDSITHQGRYMRFIGGCSR